MIDPWAAVSKVAASAAAAISLAFDIPAGVFLAGFAGSWLAVAISPPVAVIRGASIILGGAIISAFATPAVGEIVHLVAPSANVVILLKLIALGIGFIPWHQPSRDWLVSFVKRRAEKE